MVLLQYFWNRIGIFYSWRNTILRWKYRESYNHGGGDAWAFEIDFGGQLLWERCFGGSDTDSFQNIFKTEDQGYFLLGTTYSRDGDVNNTNCPYPFCRSSAWVIELDSDKNILWNGTHGSYDYSYFKRNGIRRVGERDFIIAGVVGEEGIHVGDVDCEPYPIHNGYSAWIYRLYDPNVRLQEYTHSLSLKTYPNPAFRPVQITFELPAISKESSLKIKDIFGNLVAELPLLIGQSQLQWKCSHVAGGVYFYHSKIGGEVYRGKLVIN